MCEKKEKRKSEQENRESSSWIQKFKKECGKLDVCF